MIELPEPATTNYISMSGIKHDLFTAGQLRTCIEQAAAEAREQMLEKPDPQLCKFYNVTTFPELVAAQNYHILKLQAKLPPLDPGTPTKVRFA